MPRISATDVDQIVGARITALRKEKSITQAALAGAMGLSYQQLQKYEKGFNRISAARLQEIARYFAVPISVLYSNEAETPEQKERFFFLGLPGAIDLLKAFAEIENAETRSNILVIARSVARISSGPVAKDA